jgi:hypothetical protein
LQNCLFTRRQERRVGVGILAGHKRGKDYFLRLKLKSR